MMMHNCRLINKFP